MAQSPPPRLLSPVGMLLRICAVVAVGGLMARTAWLAGGSPQSAEDLFNLWVYHGVIVAAAAICLIQSVRASRVNWAWLAFGLGLLSWTAGDLYWVVFLGDLDTITYPNWADLGYLATYPFFYAGILLLIKQRIGRMTLAMSMDGAIGGLAAGALSTAILAPTLVGVTKGSIATVTTNLAYPLADFLLIAFIVATVVVLGVRGAGALLLIGAGLLVWSAGDSYYLYAVATGGYSSGWVDQIWLLGSGLIALGAFVATPRRKVHRRSSMAFPMLFGSTAVGVLVWDHFQTAPNLSIWLAAATLVAMLIRLALSLGENRKLIATLHEESLTDTLTGLSNRRGLNDDLCRTLDPHAEMSARVFALFDLDGFKAYNDRFGHPAGDALLIRLGAGLRHAMEGLGTAYRLGGDEFCILANTERTCVESVVEKARAGLSAEGEGFYISASAGFVLLPAEATVPSEALRLADQRMYADKDQRLGSATGSTHDFLMHVARGHDLTLNHHQDGVAHLAIEVGRRLGLGAEDLDVLGRAAELHDIGKIAIPREILDKPGTLDENEWTLMRQHTLVGARMLSALPAMAPVARVVRSSHERWDGNGYPDGLAKAEIPRAARIVFVCDAYDAMCANRPYDPARQSEEVVAELRRNAGTQFDPVVVDSLCGLIADGGQVRADGWPTRRTRAPAAG